MPAQWEPLFFAFLRFSAFMVSAPFPGPTTPARLRVVLAGGLALVVEGGEVVPVFWLRAAIFEVVLGLLLGFALTLCLQAFAYAGEVGGAQMGLSNAGLGNPFSNDSNVLGSAYTFLALALFVVGDGPERMLVLLQRSCELLPVGTGGLPMNETAVAFVGPPDNAGSSLAGLFFVSTLRAAAPLIAATFAAQVVLAVLARAVPNLNWLVEGPSLTISAGLIGFLASLETLWPLLDPNLMTTSERLLRALGAGDG